MKITELTDLESLMKSYELLCNFYPSLTEQDYRNNLLDMLKLNYAQVAVFEDDRCLAVSGYWIGTKLWCGKYLELDNIVVDPSQRSRGIGKLLFDYFQEKATIENCNMMALDSYTDNFEAHKFFYREGFVPRGFHFIKVLNRQGLR